MPDIRLGEIKAMLQAQCPGLLQALVPGIRREGRIYSAPNPRRADGRHGSFKLWGNGAWREYDEPEDEGKGDILGLVAYVAGLPPKSREGRRHAIQWAKRHLGLDTMAPAQIKRTREQWSVTARQRKADQAAAEAKRLQGRVARALTIWRDTRPDDAAIGRYLAARIGVLPRLAHPVPALRLHPRLDHWAMPHGQAWRGPALVARVTRIDGTMAAIHCTWLRDDYSWKAPMPNAKLMLGPVQGCFVPLTRGAGGLTLQEATLQGHRTWLLAGEGIENSVAAAVPNPEARVWAALTLGNLAHLPLDPAIMAGVVMVLDNETKPEALRQQDRVTETLGARCDALGLPFRTMRPTHGKDFAAMLKEMSDGEEG